MWVDGWGWGARQQLEQSRAESRGSHFTQVTAVVLRDISTQGESLKKKDLVPLCFTSSLGVTVGNDRPL